MTCAYPSCLPPHVDLVPPLVTQQSHHVNQLPATGVSEWLGTLALIGTVLLAIGFGIVAGVLLGSALADWMDDHNILR